MSNEYHALLAISAHLADITEQLEEFNERLLIFYEELFC